MGKDVKQMVLQLYSLNTSNMAPSTILIEDDEPHLLLHLHMKIVQDRLKHLLAISCSSHPLSLSCHLNTPNILMALSYSPLYIPTPLFETTTTQISPWCSHHHILYWPTVSQKLGLHCLPWQYTPRLIVWPLITPHPTIQHAAVPTCVLQLYVWQWV